MAIRRNRMKSRNGLLKQAQELISRSNGESYYSGSGLAANGSARAKRIAAIFNRYAENMAKSNPDLNLSYTGKESRARIEAARNRPMSSAQYMRGESVDTRTSSYKPVDGRERMRQLRTKFADRSNVSASQKALSSSVG